MQSRPVHVVAADLGAHPEQCASSLNPFQYRVGGVPGVHLGGEGVRHHKDPAPSRVGDGASDELGQLRRAAFGRALEPSYGSKLDRLVGVVLLAEPVRAASIVRLAEVVFMGGVDVDAQVVHRREAPMEQDRHGIRLGSRRSHREAACPVGYLRIGAVGVHAWCVRYERSR
jgi:hypothetical protein